MSYKEKFYYVAGKFTGEDLKNFLKSENISFNEFYKKYKKFRNEEENYKEKFYKLKTKYEQIRS